MQFSAVRLTDPLPSGEPPSVMATYGGSGAQLDTLLSALPRHYRWVGAGGGPGRDLVGLCFDTTALSAHGSDDFWWDQAIRPGEDAPAIVVLQLWRQTGMTSIICCSVDLSSTPSDQQVRLASVLRERIRGYGEGFPVVLMGDFGTDEAYAALLHGGLLVDTRPERQRSGTEVLVVPSIQVTTGDPHAGPGQAAVDLTIRHRRDQIATRTWTAVGAVLESCTWSYHPERASARPCKSYADAMDLQRADTMLGGHIEAAYRLRNPDDTTVHGRSTHGGALADVRKRSVVTGRRYVVVRRGEKLGSYDEPGRALRNGWAWAAERIDEVLTLAAPSGVEFTATGNNLRLIPEIVLS